MTTVPTRTGHILATASGTAAAVADISGVADGSWMVAALLIGSSVSSGTIPAGWTALSVDQPIGSRVTRFVGKIKDGDTSVSWNSASGAFKSLHVMYGTGADAVANWIRGSIAVRNATNIVSGQSMQGGSSTTCVAPTVTAPEANSLVLCIFAEATTNTGAGSITAGGSTFWFNAGDITTYIEQLTVSYLTPDEDTATAQQTATYSQVQASNGLGFQLVIPPLPDAVEEPYTALDGNGDEVEIWWIDSNGDPQIPVDLIPVPNGYKSVDDMLSRHEFYWAHRGGSGPFPEHALWSYTQSVIRWYGGLEVSLARTSDGVWFGLHDQDINRTSGLAAGTKPAASSMTWAEVNAYEITIGSRGGNHPYMRLIDLLTAYGNSHVLIIDAKYQTSQISDLMNQLQTFYGSDAEASKHVIMKNYGVGSALYVAAVNARGYKTWGYFYDTDAANYAANAAKWDLLGLSYNADQSYWNQLAAAAPGHRIVGHICPNTSAVNTARLRGATGFQCSGVIDILPDNS